MLIPKQTYIEDKKWIRFVATLSCMRCNAQGRTQAAHLGTLKHGKGKGRKASDDTVAPLCTVNPPDVGCHEKYDQYKEWTDGERARALNTAIVAYGFFKQGKPQDAALMFAGF